MAALSASAQPTTGVVYDPVFGSYECPWDRQHVENPERWRQGNICWQCVKIFPCQVRVRGAAVRGAGAAGALCPGGGQVMMVMMMVMITIMMMMMMTRSITTEEATSCHSPALLSQLASTQQLDTEQLQQLAASWDCVYLHNNIWPAAERAAGGVIDLVSGGRGSLLYDD